MIRDGDGSRRIASAHLHDDVAALASHLNESMFGEDSARRPT
jgi:hypothetical protein